MGKPEQLKDAPLYISENMSNRVYDERRQLGRSNGSEASNEVVSQAAAIYEEQLIITPLDEPIQQLPQTEWDHEKKVNSSKVAL